MNLSASNLRKTPFLLIFIFGRRLSAALMLGLGSRSTRSGVFLISLEILVVRSFGVNIPQIVALAQDVPHSKKRC